jgi:hypothetical protein
MGTSNDSRVEYWTGDQEFWRANFEKHRAWASSGKWPDTVQQLAKFATHFKILFLHRISFRNRPESRLAMVTQSFQLFEINLRLFSLR